MKNKKFNAETERLMDLMINSIYTNKEIFLRELISNASDAMDKMYYIALNDDNVKFNHEDYYIRITPDKDKRTITIEDGGVGMTEDELVENLGTIAKSGSFDFKKLNEKNEDHEIIGQFGVGFYSAFMVADEISVLTRSYKEDEAHIWKSKGAKGYTIESGKKDSHGTVITLHLKENSKDEDYDKYLDEYKIRELVSHYSNYISYPIKMEVEKKRPAADSTEDDPKFESYREDDILNSSVPMWRKNKNELKEDDYNNFFRQRHFGFEDPLAHIHISVEGVISFKAILYIPSRRPFDFLNPDRKGGLELYSNGVLIMEKCEDLLPDYLNFIKGVVDSEDISLNISREMLQKTRELQLIKKNIEKKILEELAKILKNDREKYAEFFKNFGVSLKSGAYENYGADKDKLKDLFIYTTTKRENITFNEYRKDMTPDQEFIYYANGNSIESVKELPQIKHFIDKDIEVIALTDPIDEFVIKMMDQYDDKKFKSISETDATKEEDEKNLDDYVKKMKDILSGEVSSIRENPNLKDDAAYLSSKGEISIEMEKTLSHMPNNQGFKADKVLELNPNHPAVKKLKDMDKDSEEFKNYTELLYDGARLMAGLDIKDPISYARNVSKLM
ncbi:MAG: molecular chaperone HtpG [Peptoniphilaceae bacterium]|uniref:molecular chaperone HtpG n=1 Tax=Peptoniphilus sp. TaxID=1971214 RepID=UPI0029729143|nr:molecular chaperone HtpG [Peptoniphilus sp.]MDD7353162.1 molecular chaperone HtpG [Peptoniphilaceae bacterium]MDY3902467.1 molecular chaperone HtpG [Peptoniphilus sp.]